MAADVPTKQDLVEEPVNLDGEEDDDDPAITFLPVARASPFQLFNDVVSQVGSLLKAVVGLGLFVSLTVAVTRSILIPCQPNQSAVRGIATRND